jgi:hypothetical protein
MPVRWRNKWKSKPLLQKGSRFVTVLAHYALLNAFESARAKRAPYACANPSSKPKFVMQFVMNGLAPLRTFRGERALDLELVAACDVRRDVDKSWRKSWVCLRKKVCVKQPRSWSNNPKRAS